VTRAAIAIILHCFTQQYYSQSGFWLPAWPIALSTGGLAVPQALPTHKNEYKQNPNNNEVIKENQNFYYSIVKTKRNLTIITLQGGLDLEFHGLILWGWFSCVAEISEVFNSNKV
jgi:hypothetical protein